jgi:hypothetical protein
MNFKLWLYQEESEFADGTATISPTIKQEKNNQKIQEIAAFYRDNGKYPSTISTIESEKQLGSWLRNKRQAYMGRGRYGKYEGEEQYGISLGLPNDWLKIQIIVSKEEHYDKIRKLAAFYRDNGKYPSTTSTIESERQLGIWLIKKRQAYMGRGSGAAKHEGEGEYGISLGLPNDWLELQSTEEKLQEKNNQKIRQLAVFYRDNGEYPSTISTIESEKQLGSWLGSKRQAYQGRSAVAKYEGEGEYGISLGLPNDWLESQITKRKLKLQEKNNQKIRQLAVFYRDNGKYPNTTSTIESEKQLGKWLRDRRQAYLGRGQYAKYEGEEQYGISLGLPNDWLKPQIITTKEEHYDKIRQLAAFYRDNGKYPSTISAIESERQLGRWLGGKRQAYQGRSAVAKYEGEGEYGISLGLPNDWLKLKKRMKQINQPNIVQNDPEISV